jgi:hypothetical protein
MTVVKDVVTLVPHGTAQAAKLGNCLVKRVELRVELRGLEPLTPTLPGAGGMRDQAR